LVQVRKVEVEKVEVKKMEVKKGTVKGAALRGKKVSSQFLQTAATDNESADTVQILFTGKIARMVIVLRRHYSSNLDP
jgi:hypothetical protein